MAVTATLETDLSDQPQPVYVRLNNVQVVNMGVTAGTGEETGNPQSVFASALFRGFASAAAFEAGRRFLLEQTVEFEPDLTQPLWPQAYATLKSLPAYSKAVDA